MATSNSTNFEPDVTEFVEEAFERCGLELRTGYDLKTAKRSINLMLAEWANRGLNQWTIEQPTQTVTKGTNQYTLDLLSEFKHINLNISIDGIGRIAEFVRYGTKWSKFERNWNKWLKWIEMDKNTRYV